MGAVARSAHPSSFRPLPLLLSMPQLQTNSRKIPKSLLTMEEEKNKPSKRNRLAKIGKVIAEIVTALISTIVSAVVVVILYILYIPFAVGRALFNRKAIRGFYSDVFYAVDGIGQRIRKREEVENE